VQSLDVNDVAVGFRLQPRFCAEVLAMLLSPQACYIEADLSQVSTRYIAVTLEALVDSQILHTFIQRAVSTDIYTPVGPVGRGHQQSNPAGWGRSGVCV